MDQRSVLELLWCLLACEEKETDSTAASECYTQGRLIYDIYFRNPCLLHKCQFGVCEVRNTTTTSSTFTSHLGTLTDDGGTNSGDGNSQESVLVSLAQCVSQMVGRVQNAMTLQCLT